MRRLPGWLYTSMREKRRRAGKPSRVSTHPLANPRVIGEDSHRGAALIMVLLLTTILGAMAADLANSTAVNLALAANARDRLQAHFHARSAVQLELFFLRYSAALNKTLGQFLPFPLADMSSFFVSSDTVKGLLKRDRTPEDEKIKGSFAEDKPFGAFEGSFWVEEVVDENRKINIRGKGVPPGCENPVHILLGALIQEKRYDILFENIGDSRDPLRNRIEIIGNITDYNDPDDTLDRVCAFTGERATSGGASEDVRYDRLPYGARYKPKNGPMYSLSELRMMPGVNDAFLRLFGDQLTVWTDGPAINMKQAPDMLVIAALQALMGRPALPGDEERFAKFLEERNLMRILPPPLNQLNKSAFETIAAKVGIPLDPARKTLLMDGPNAILKFDDPTAVYRITAMGRVGDTTSTMTVVWRDSHQGGQGDVFYWRED
jgi:hypothetical protein